MEPFIIDGTTYLPVRAISSLLGYAVNWNDARNEITVSGRYDFALATDEIRPDVNDIVFPTKNVDPELKVGDIALYYFDGSEWYIQRALAETGTLVEGEDKDAGEFVLNDVQRLDALITRYNLQAANRTSQFLSAHTALQLESVPVTQWSTLTGYPIGFTRGENAKAALELAVPNARAIAAQYQVSEDGADVPVSEEWVTKAIMDAYLESIDAALGSATGRQPSGVLGNAKPGSLAVPASN